MNNKNIAGGVMSNETNLTQEQREVAALVAGEIITALRTAAMGLELSADEIDYVVALINKAMAQPAAQSAPTYVIEYLSGSGFWTPLTESTYRTGFRMLPVAYESRDAAESAVAEMKAGAPGQWRGLRVRQLGVEAAVMSTVTDSQIKSLSTEAAEHGDTAQVAICERALAGDDDARRECERVIADAAAQVAS